MPTKKNFSAINDFLTPKTMEVDNQVEEIMVQPQVASKEPEVKKSQAKSVLTQTNRQNSSIKSVDPTQEGFIRWTTYINPKYKRILKLMAVEGDTEIYKLLDALLEKELKKK